MWKRVVAALGSKAMRNGLRRPQAKVSWQIWPTAATPMLQRAVPAPVKGLPGGTLPSRSIRRIFPTGALRSREASLEPAQPLGVPPG